MATKWRIRERLGNAIVYVIGFYLIFGFVKGWIFDPLFSTPKEPEACGPHSHMRPIGAHRDFDQMGTDYGCVEDAKWACRKAARSLDSKELADIGCGSEE